MVDQTFTIGFTNLDTSVYAMAVERSLREAAAEFPHINLVVRNNDLSDEQALAHAQEFADMQVNLVIVFHINERLGSKLQSILRGVPLIAIDIPIPLVPYFGIDNQYMGTLAGQAITQWVQSKWNGQLDKIMGLIDHRVLESVRQRTQGAVQLIHDEFPDSMGTEFFVDCGSSREGAAEMTENVLKRWRDKPRIAIIGFNEESTLGAQDTVTALGMEDQVAIVGHAASDILMDMLETNDTQIIASTATYPDDYGKPLIELALQMLEGKPYKRKNHILVDVLHSNHFAEMLS